jgi:rRNA maturation RNase YbeY
MNQINPSISFHFLSAFKLSQRKKLKAFIASLFRREKHRLTDLSFVFCSDDYLLKLNHKFLNHHYFTDILSFALSPPGSRQVSGEIYISVDRVRENARELGVSFQEEMHRVIFHGALHLCHYKDKSPKEQSVMRAKEDKYLSLYFK